MLNRKIHHIPACTPSLTPAHRDTQAITSNKLKTEFRNARLKAKAYTDKNRVDFEWFLLKDLRAKAAAETKTHIDAQKLLGHRDSKTTAIYRRDKNEAVMPLDENNLFLLEKKVK